MTRRRCIDCRGGIDDDASTHCEGCHSELLAEQIGRAEAAELERDQLRARCESAERRAETAEQRAERLEVESMKADQELSEALERAERLAEHWRNLAEEVEHTQQWRACKGMRPTTDCSEYASAPPSVLIRLARAAKAALTGKESGK